jgi:cyclitol reductase
MKTYTDGIYRFPMAFKSVGISGGEPVMMEYPFPAILDEYTVVVETKLAGVCRSDLKEATGTRTVRHDFGHEIAGIVRWAGKADGLSSGDTVCLDPHVDIERNSGFSEYIIARGETRDLGRAFIKLPQDILADRSVFCEPMACAQHCIANLLRYLNSESLTGLRVAVIGAGNAGTLIGMIAKHMGASLTLFNRGSERLKFLAERKLFLRNELCLMKDNCPAVFNAVIVATSFLYPSVMTFALQGLREGAILMLYGGTREGDLLANTKLNVDHIRRKELVAEATYDGKQLRVGGTYGALSEDFARVTELLKNSDSYFPLELLITQRIGLDNLPATLFSLIETEQSYFGKIIVGIS